jgi:hypothetical protein
VQRKNDQDNSSLPGCGIFVLALLAALILGGLWGGTEIYRRANLSERYAALFASEGISTAARVVRVQRRGGGNDRRSTLHYRYVVGDREYAGATTVRRADCDRHEPGSQIVVRYLDRLWRQSRRSKKKRSDQGTYWRVHYEWTLLSGGKRQGRYNHGKKQPPAVGVTIPIVYDRDHPLRHSRYPLSLVAVSDK